MGSTNVLVAGALAAGALFSASCPAWPVRAGPIINVARMSAPQQGFGPLERPSDAAGGGLVLGGSEWPGGKDLLGPAVGSDYFTVDANNGAVFFLGGILVDAGTHLDLEGPLNLDELDMLSSAKPAGLALLGASLLGLGLLSRRKG